MTSELGLDSYIHSLVPTGLVYMHFSAAYSAFSGLFAHISISSTSRATVVDSEMPRWLEPNGRRGTTAGITSVPAGDTAQREG